MLPGMGCSDSAKESSASPSAAPLHAKAFRGPTPTTDRQDRTSLSVGMLSDRARRNTRDRFHRFYQRDDFTGSTCVPCVKTVELERPPICRVKPAQLKSHESQSAE